MALDKAVKPRESPERHLINHLRKHPFSGRNEDETKLPPLIRNDTLGDSELKKQIEINRRLNELLNDKDEEIIRLNGIIMQRDFKISDR